MPWTIDNISANRDACVLIVSIKRAIFIRFRMESLRPSFSIVYVLLTIRIGELCARQSLNR